MVKKEEMGIFFLMEHFQECEGWLGYDSCPYFWTIAQCGNTEQTLSISGENCAHSLVRLLRQEPILIGQQVDLITVRLLVAQRVHLNGVHLLI